VVLSYICVFLRFLYNDFLIYFSINLASNYSFSYNSNVDFVIMIDRLGKSIECHIRANRLLQ
jgi:hypothetical protein